MKPQAPEITNVLHVSSSHLTESGRYTLDYSSRTDLIAFPKDVFGWFIYLQHDGVNEAIENVEASLRDVLKFGQAHNCSMVVIDRDGPVTTGLPVYYDPSDLPF